MVKKVLVAALVALALAASEVAAMEYYVSEQGNDAWSGRLPDPNAAKTDGPFRTLAKAAGAVGPGDVCSLRAGTYREVLRPAASGQPGKPILFRAYKDEMAILSAADPLTGWTRDEGNVFAAPMEWSLDDGNQLFVGGEMFTEARWPDNEGTLLQPTRASASAGSSTTLTDPKLPGGPDAWKGALLWCAGGAKWIAWSGRVTGFDPATKTLTFDCKEAAGNWYTPKAGSEYVLMGVRAALDAEGEWWYDAERKRVLLIPPAGKDPGALAVEAKRRAHVMDLSGRSHVQVVGLRFRAGGILTDSASTDLLLKGLHGEYVGHSYLRDVPGVVIQGARNTVLSCEFAYASGSVLTVGGSDNRVINCYVHDGNYGGKWSGTVKVSGRRHLVSHNTFRHSGRDLLSIHGLMESVIQYNDLSDAGWLTHDLGMTYGHNTDFAGTVIHHNRVHDNRAKGLGMGIYFDHLSHNVVVHSNLLWNVTGDAIRINNPSYFDLVYNNTCYNTNTASKQIGSFDHSRRQDLYAVRWLNNLFNVPLALPENAVVGNNLALPDPGYADPVNLVFTLKPDSPAAGAGVYLGGVTPGTAGTAADAGAFPRGAAPWRAGHDFAHPPEPEPVLSMPEIAWMNAVRNACFETGTVEGWTKTDAGAATITPGNGWGNNWGSERPPEPTGTSKHELRLGPGVDGVEQRVEGLRPSTAHTLSAWAKVSVEGESVSLALKEHPEAAASTGATGWTRLVVEFKTGAGETAVTVALRKTSPGQGFAFVDNVGLPRTP